MRDLPGARNAPRLRGQIEFEHVTFSYQAEYPVLRDVSLRIEPGHVAALVGPTGAGKTTIISLIPRFYDPDFGGDPHRRHRYPALPHAVAAPADQLCVAGNAAVSRADLEQHRVRETRRQPRRDSARSGTGQRARVHRKDAAGLRHPDRRARRDAFRRPAPADRDRARHHSQYPDPDPGRTSRPASMPHPKSWSSRRWTG